MADVKFDDLPEVTDPQDDDILPMDEDSSGNTSFIRYKNLQKMGVKVNLLGNSGFGVWSNSDTNKGLSRGTPVENVSVDSGAVLPVVGETLTDTISNTAVGKVISITDTNSQWGAGTGTATISLGACSKTPFIDNADLDGSVAGANCCTLNMPPTAAGVDEVRNGSFTVDEDPPQGWTASNATLSTEAGGDVGNCMKVLDGGGGNGYGYQSITTVIGKIYTFSCYAKDIDTGQNGLIEVGTAAGDDTYYSSEAITDDAGATYTVTLEATTTTTVISLNCTSAAGAYYFDSVVFYEITPCITTGTAGPDGLVSSGNLSLYRQHNDATYTKDGSFYSLKVVKERDASDIIRWPGSGVNTLSEFYTAFLGKTVTVGCWIYSVTATDNVKVGLYHNGAWNYSSFAGADAWEWIEVTQTIDASSTDVRFGILFDGSTGDIAYISQPMDIFGSSIGEGNYVQMPGETVKMAAQRALTSYTAVTVNANADINLEAESDGVIPKGCKAIRLRWLGKQAAADKALILYDKSGGCIQSRLISQVANITVEQAEEIYCDENGDIRIERADSWDGVYLYVSAVKVS